MQVGSRWALALGDEPIWDIALEPQTQRRVIVGCGSTIYVINAANGDVEGKYTEYHEDTIHSVAWGKDSEDNDIIATGGKDKTVIIWEMQNEQLKPRVKFTHATSVQKIKFSPTKPGRLISCAVADFGFWSPEAKDVTKTSVSHRITDVVWEPRGNHIAFATEKGKISICNSTKGQEVKKIEHKGKFIWTINWTEDASGQEIIIVYDWHPSITTYNAATGQLLKSVKTIDFNPCCSSPLQKLSYIAVGGSDGELTLLTREGIRLTKLDSGRNSFIWSVASREIAGKQEVISGNQEGRLASHTIALGKVHGMYNKFYATRMKLTSIEVTDLEDPFGERAIVRSREIIDKIALSEDLLVAQSREKIKVWQRKDALGNSYEYLTMFQVPEMTSLIICAAQNVLVCIGDRISSYHVNGAISREWVMSSPVRYMKMLPGPIGGELCLVGTDSGAVFKIFINQSFPIEVQSVRDPVYLCDLSQYREKVLIVDDKNLLSVFDIYTNELLYQEPGVTSAAWNLDEDDLLCFTTMELLVIKAGEKTVFTQKLKNLQRVVGFSKDTVYLIDGEEIDTVQVPQTGAMYHFIENEDLETAYNMACIGVTTSDWNYLASVAMSSLDLKIAKRAFSRTGNYRKLVLVDELMKLQGTVSPNELKAIIAAYNGEYDQMEKFFKDAGCPEKAMDIFTDLRMFDRARNCLEGQSDTHSMQVDQNLREQEADWAAEGLRDARSAAEMYLKAGQSLKAIEALGTLNSAERLIDAARRLDKGDRKGLQRCVELLRDMGQWALCAEVYGKMGDWESLIELYAKTDQWDEVFSLVQRKPDLSSICWTLRADWLAEKDLFVEAQDAFYKAGKPGEALKVLTKLTECAVTESRFNDAAHYYHLLSVQCEQLLQDQPEESNFYLEQYNEYRNLSEIYYAYHFIHRFVEEPFSAVLQETIMYAARFLWHRVQNMLSPPGVSKVYILSALAKTARQFGNFKAARYCYGQMKNLRIPKGPMWDEFQLGALSIRGKPYRDSEDFEILCPRCACSNSLINPAGDFCSNCQAPFVYSYSNFEPVPLIEFFLEDGIDQEEAEQLMDTAAFEVEKKKSKKSESNRMDLTASMAKSDFDTLLMDTDGEDIIASRSVMKTLSHNNVLIQKFPVTRWRFFKNVMPNVEIAIDPDSQRFFISEDWEMQLLQSGESPFSRRKIKDELDESAELENLLQ